MRVATMLTATVAASFGVAFAFEWLCLRTVMGLMPARQVPARPAMLAPQPKQN